MAKSREEFMREMGISTDDAMDPSKKETKFVTAFSSGDQRQAPSTTKSDHHSYGGPRSPPRNAAPTSTTRASGYSSGPLSSQHQYSPAPAPKREVEDISQYHNSAPYTSAPPMEKPISSVSSKKNDASPPMSSARAEFLASLGIDNMDTPGTETSSSAPAPPPRNPVAQTASQEYYKDSAAVLRGGAASGSGSYDKENRITSPPQKTNSSSNNVKHMALQRNVSFSDAEEESGSGSYESSAPREQYKPPMKQDSIMGLRKSRSNLSDSAAGHNHSTTSSSSLPDPHDNMSVDELKATGNKYFEEGEFRKAVRLYSKGIEKDSTNAALYSNRSAAYLQASKQMGIDTRMMALRDADKVIELRGNWFKGYSRRGDALFKLDRASEAADAYQNGLNLDVGNVNLMHSLGEAKAAAGGTRPSHASSWVTTSSSAHSKPSSTEQRNAHELVDELRQQMDRTNPDALMGHDYRAEALQRFRSGKATSSLSSFCGEAPAPMSNVSSNSAPAPAPPARKLDRSQITEEFSSSAAHGYQQGLLDAYRQKKRQQQQQ